MMKKAILLAFFAAVLFTVDAAAQASQRVKFPTGAISTTLAGSVRGYAYRDYVIRASAGQRLNVKVNSRNTYTILTVLAPDGDALDGASEVDQYQGNLPSTDDYVVRVAMMRAGARRPGAVSNYTLKITIR